MRRIKFIRIGMNRWMMFCLSKNNIWWELVAEGSGSAMMQLKGLYAVHKA